MKLINLESQQLSTSDKDETELIQILKNFFFRISSLDTWDSMNINNSSSFLFEFFKKKLLILKEKYDNLKLGNTIKIFESYRSNQRQHYLYHSGASNVQFLGMHYFMIAVDIVFFKDNKISWNGDYNKLWEIGKQLFMNPVSSSDLCHFQYIQIGEQNTLRKIYKRVIWVFQQLTNLKTDMYLGPKTHTALIQSFPYFDDNWKKIINLI